MFSKSFKNKAVKKLENMGIMEGMINNEYCLILNPKGMMIVFGILDLFGFMFGLGIGLML